MNLRNISIVLVRPKFAGNVGAAARAMKVMGINNLRLVAPSDFREEEAMWMAHGSEEILHGAKSYKKLVTAVRGARIIVGTTHRERHIYSSTHYLRECSSEIIKISKKNRLAILFGPEDTGLLNEELAICNMVATIPQAIDYPSLNLAQSVMLVCYELLMASETKQEPLARLAAQPQLDRMYAHIAKVIDTLGYGTRELLPDKIIQNIRKIFGRTTLTSTECNMVRGLCTQIEKTAVPKGHKAK